MKYLHDIAGETIGTFILVFFGCGAVMVAVLFTSHISLFQIGVIWGIGVTLAIYATRHLSCAHFNPAVSLAMVVGGRMVARKLPLYVGAQFFGAFLAAVVLYLLFSNSISAYEMQHAIVRGTPESVQTAMMFGEFYPNPAAGKIATVSTMNAFWAEATGTFALVFLIFALTEGCNVGRPDDAQAPVFIGLTVAVIICIVAPLTQAGINPARDRAPRFFAYMAGWRQAAMPDSHYGFITVYVLGPLFGGISASLLFTKLLQPLMNNKGARSCICNEKKHRSTRG